MTAIICFVPDTGYCLVDANGYLICAIWFDTEQAAVDYCNEHGMSMIFQDEECY